jgi:hypothetical protein
MSLDFDAEDLSEDLVLSNPEFCTDKVDVLKVKCSPKFGQVAKIEKRPENEQQKSWNKAPATA